MKHLVFLLLLLPLSLISWKQPESQHVRHASFQSVSAPTDTIRLHEMRFADFMSPNGDGYNDRFVITHIAEYPANILKIFNRWGDMVYMAEPYENEFDGYSNVSGAQLNNKLADGVYFFEFSDGLGNKVNGNLTIKR